MTIHSNKFVAAVITLGGGSDYSCQCTELPVNNVTPDGAKVYTFCASGAGEFREVPDSQWQLAIKWVSDWTTSGLNRYCYTNDGDTVAFSINLDPGVTGYDRTWTGNVVIKQPSDGGAVRATEMSSVVWNCIGVPVLTYAS